MGLSNHINSNVIEYSPRSRTPLAPRTTSPTQVAAKQVRRKTSFVLRADSSEEIASPHDSIFDAFYFPATSSDENSNRIELITFPDCSTLVSSDDSRGNDENNREQGAAADQHTIGDTEFRYGHGTVLETITEKRSCATIGTLARAKSVDNTPNFPLLHHRDSFSIAKSPRKASFSVGDDIALIKSSYHEACAMIERTTCGALPIHEIYAQPKAPIHAPLQRPPTPPGMPSWTAAQTIPPCRSPGSSQTGSSTLSRLRSFLGISASGAAQPTPGANPVNRAVSAPVRGGRTPRFRPPRSAYGPIDQHPFNNAPVATVHWGCQQLVEGASTNVQESRSPKHTGKRRLGPKVQFTPSATARDPEAVALQTAIKSSSTSALHPITSMEPIPGNDGSHSPPRQIQCLHRKGRLAALKALKEKLNHANTTPSDNDYTILPSYPANRQASVSSKAPTPTSSPTRLNSITSINVEEFGVVDHEASRTVSVSSTAHLMPGALLDRSSLIRESLPLPVETVRSHTPLSQIPENPIRCWKCRLETVFSRIDQWWMKSTSFACFLCCGFDVDDDMSVSYGSMSGDRGMSAYSATLRGDAGSSREDMLRPRRVVLESTPVVL